MCSIIIIIIIDRLSLGAFLKKDLEIWLHTEINSLKPCKNRNLIYEVQSTIIFIIKHKIIIQFFFEN